MHPSVCPIALLVLLVSTSLSLGQDTKMPSLFDLPQVQAANAQQTVKITPALPVDGQVMITPANMLWVPHVRMFQVFVKPPEKDSPHPAARGLGNRGKQLARWYEARTAAGNNGDLYDNHDSDHSNMSVALLPQFTRVEFSDAIKTRKLHYGLQRFFLYNAVTIGNSSTAVTGTKWRSQTRYALTLPGGAARLYLQYRANQLYFYPEHRDYDAGHNGKNGGYGDVYPGNTPYVITSQGSSGSDRVFMNAVGETLAAFHPEVKSKLARAGMLMPTVQMILRRNNINVKTDDDYFTGQAHPPVFQGSDLHSLYMIHMAHNMTPELLPPLVQIRVVEEDTGVAGIDYFAHAIQDRRR
jgi:hypothetical protein